MLGSKPSDLIPWFDFYRFTELLVDGKTETPPANPAALNANERAIALVRTAENDIVQAVRTKQQYTVQALQDLVRDYQMGGDQGHQIVSLIADLAWCHAIGRKRYPKGTPQGEEPACDRAKEEIKQLQAGSLIFVMEGVEMTDGAGHVVGTYDGQGKPNAGMLTGSTLKGGIGHPVGLWGTQRKEDIAAEMDPYY